jgi:hypothetical protein
MLTSVAEAVCNNPITDCSTITAQVVVMYNGIFRLHIIGIHIHYVIPLDANVVQHCTCQHISTSSSRIGSQSVMEAWESSLQYAERLLDQDPCAGVGVVVASLVRVVWCPEGRHHVRTAGIRRVAQQQPLSISTCQHISKSTISVLHFSIELIINVTYGPMNIIEITDKFYTVLMTFFAVIPVVFIGR